MTTDELQPQAEAAPEEQTAPAAVEPASSPTAETPAVAPEAPAEAEAPVEAAAPAVEAAAPEQPAAPAPEAPAEAPVSRADDAALFEAAMASLESEDAADAAGKINRGDRVEAKVILVDKDRVFVDLGTKAEGVIPLKELTDDSVDTAIGLVNVGDRFDVIVIKTSSAEGNPIVSKKRADFDASWQNIIKAFEDGITFQATVVDRVKGGLVVDIGVRGFVPATHVGTGRLRNIEKYVGDVLPVKIIEIDKERKKVVLSNRVAEEETREESRKGFFTKINPGDVIPGVVSRLKDYGAFVDLGGIDGLLHISEISWMRIDHPKEVLKEGDEINVYVLRLDEGTGKISLGLRQVLPDPWQVIGENYKVGQKIQVQVNRMVQSGVFVRLPEQAEAFLPLSEISEKRLKRPEDELEQDQDIEPTIIDLKPDERRMVLSLRENPRLGGPSRMGGPGLGRRPSGPGRRRDGDYDQPAPSPQRQPTGGATIGERLGMLKGLIKNDGPEEETTDES